MKKFLLSTLVLLLTATGLFAQVTTSSITGSVKDTKGEALIGATIKAIHQPSGTVYGSSTNVDGRFNIPSARIGGPYQIEVSYVGFAPKKFSDVTLRLGEPFILNVSLDASGTQLQEVVISAAKGTAVAKTGATTNISSRQLATLPTISRSIADFTRLTPQANGNGFAGRDPRYNNLQVDGANLNNNFGLSNDPMPGGGAQPISLDAYDEISVNIAPYDVRQSGFTGAGINAVTKSGTNTVKGSAYTYYRDQSFNGTKVGGLDISNSIAKSKTQIYGGTVGGPIIKNKLFFFVNGEYEKATKPGVPFSPTGGSGLGTVSQTNASDLQRVSDFLRTNYGYETGPFDNFPAFGTDNHKILAKIDWNINQVHKFTAKYSDFVGNDDQLMNGSSVPNGGGFFVGGKTVSRLPFNRFSNNSMSFANSNYGFRNVVRTATAELNSNFGGRMSNQLLATYTKTQATRDFPGSVFPTIDIFDGAGNNYISAGMDPYTYNNDVINDTYSLIDNFTYYAGKHTLTAGASYEYQKVGNMFMAGSNGYYAYNSLNDFLTNAAPAYFAYTYSLVPGQSSVYSAELKIGQLGVYAQDDINFNNGLKLTVGLRGDVPIYQQSPLANPAINALQLYSQDGTLTTYNSGKWPKSKFLLSPRVGFRWDVLNDNSLTLRGGTGIFTGRIPFVFLTNMPTNSGMYQFGGAIKDPAILSTIRFSADPSQYANLFPTAAGTSVPSNFVVMDPDFKFPQVFRTNLGVDKKLGDGFTASFEGLFSKDINGVKMRNANLGTPTGTITEGGLTRPRFVDVNGDGRVDARDRSLNPSVNTAIALENSAKGYSTSLTGQLSKSFSNGLYGSVAYTYTLSKEVTANPGSQASSVWNSNPNVGTSNDVELGYSQYATPHRVVASVSYRREYAKHFASTISLFYEGANQANYSFVVNGDLNGDGNSSTDLMYIPRNTSEMNFEQYTNAGVTYTSAQQAEAFEKFIGNSPYLKNHRGQFAERNAALTPWYNRVDMRFLQDFYVQTGMNKVKHTLQFSVDVLNVPNLISKNWGIKQQYVINNPLEYRSVDATGKPLYRLKQLNGNLTTEPFQDVKSTLSTWGMQLGLRYSF